MPYLLQIFVYVFALGMAIDTWWRGEWRRDRYLRCALVADLVILAAPLLLLALTVLGGHPVAQMSSSRTLWRFWGRIWPGLLLAVMLAALVLVADGFALLVDGRPIGGAEVTFYLASLAGVWPSMSVLLASFPDA